jgi:hypothetical protein
LRMDESQAASRGGKAIMNANMINVSGRQ